MEEGGKGIGAVGIGPGHHHLVAGLGSGGEVDIIQLTGGAVAEHHGSAGIEVAPLFFKGRCLSILPNHRLRQDGDLLAAGGDIVGVHRAGDAHPADQVVAVGTEGEELAVLILGHLAADAQQVAGNTGASRPGTEDIATAGEGDAVGAGGAAVLHGKEGDVLGQAASQLPHQIALLGALTVGEEQVAEELGGLAPGDGGVARQIQPVGQAALLGQGEIAVIPGRAGGDVGGGIAQNADEDGHRLAKGNGPVGLKAAVAHTQNEPVPGGAALLVGGRRTRQLAAGGEGGGQVHITSGPVAGAYVCKDGAAPLGRLQIPLAHDAHRHFTKFRPAQGTRRAEIAASRAVHHVQQPEDLSGFRHVRVLDVGKGAAPCRRDGQQHETHQQGRGQQPGQNTFTLHVLLSFTRCSLGPQGFHRLETAGLDGGIDAENHAQHHREGKGADGDACRRQEHGPL